MKDSSATVETRGKARHDHNHKNHHSNVKHEAGAKRPKKASGEEVSKRAKKSEEDLNEPLRGAEHEEHEQKKHEGKKSREEEEPEMGEDEVPESPSASAEDLAEFVAELKSNVTVEELKSFLEENGLDSSGTDEHIYERSADALMFGPCKNCPVCGGTLEYSGQVYRCSGYISEWSRCNYTATDNVRRAEKCQIPPSLKNEFLRKWVESHEPVSRPLTGKDKFLSGLNIVLAGRMSRPQGEMKKAIEKYGGTVANAVRPGVSAVLCSEYETAGGGSSKTAEAVDLGIPICKETWLEDSIEKMQALPLQAYNMSGQLIMGGDEIPWDQRPPEEEAAVALMAELKLVGKRGVYADTNLQEQGGKIYEANDIIYNCAFSMCDITVNINQYAIMQLIEVDGANTGDGEGQKIYLYFKEGRVGDLRSSQERLDLQDTADAAVEEFVRLFEDVTGNDFESWELEKVVEKKRGKYVPLDMAPGVDARAGGLGVRQLGISASHCHLDPRVVEFLKLLYSQEVYRFALSEMGLDCPDIPAGNLTDWHIDHCKEILEEFAEYLKKGEDDEEKETRMCVDFSNKWFSLLHTTRPVVISSLDQLAELGAATLESVRDIACASRIIGDLTGDTLDDPISERYMKMGCEMTPLYRESEDYKMIVKYMITTMEPLKEADGDYNCMIEDIVMLNSKAAPSLQEMTKKPNKVLLWCGTRTSNLVACLSRGMLPAIFDAPGVPGYSFGRGLYCYDAACKAAKYGFTAVDRPDGFLLLAIVSLGEETVELPALEKDPKEYEKAGEGIKGLGKRTPDKEGYFKWKHDVTVPCGALRDSNVDGAVLDYNEYVVYNPKQVMPVFLVRTRYEGVVTME